MGILVAIFSVSALICPLSAIIFITIQLFQRLIWKTPWVTTALTGGVSVILLFAGIHTQAAMGQGIAFAEPIMTLMNGESDSAMMLRWIIGEPLHNAVALLVIYASFLGVVILSPKRLLLHGERNREQKQISMRGEQKYYPPANVLIFAKSGYGKSAYIAKSIEAVLEKDPDSCILVGDGKGSIEQYSLYYSMRILAQKYNKKLVVINGTGNEALDEYYYDFLEDVRTADQATDLIMALLVDPSIEMSSGSEHYRQKTEAYLIQLIDIMLKYDIPVTLSNVVQMMVPNHLRAQLDLCQIKAMDRKKTIEHFEKEWPEIEDSQIKLQRILHGIGARLFTQRDGKKGYNVRRAYREKAMVLVLAEGLSIRELSEKLMLVFTMDVRNLVGNRLSGIENMDERVFVYYDEFNAYDASLPLIKDLYCRCRSGRSSCTLSSQAITDLSRMGKTWFDSIVESSERYIIFRQAGAEASEAAAALIGTENHVTQTLRKSDLGLTGESSNTVDKAFIIHPDQIRKLPKNVGLRVDAEGDRPIVFENEFIIP